MFCKHYLLIASGMLAMSYSANATTLNVYYLNGNPQEQYSSETVRSVTLPSSDKLVINNYDGSTAVNTSIGDVRSIVLGESSGVENVKSDESRYRVYPNPVTETLSIDQLEKGTHIYLFNLSGQMLEDKVSSDSQEVLNLSSLEAGTYILKINKESYKIIKTK